MREGGVTIRRNNRNVCLIIVFTFVSIFVITAPTTSIVKNEENQSLMLIGSDIYGGEIRIEGPTNNPTVWCSARNNLLIPVGPNGANVTIYVNYSMDCPGDADDGYCCLSLVGDQLYAENSTGTHAEGRLEIHRFFYPGNIVIWELYAKYTDWWGQVLLGEDTDFGGGITSNDVTDTLTITTIAYGKN